MKEEKLEQLRTVFEPIIRRLILEAQDLNNIMGFEEVNTYAEETSKELVYEVKIRINNK